MGKGDSERSLDLSPHDFQRVGEENPPKPREPIFQPGGLWFLTMYVLIGMSTGMSFLYIKRLILN